MLDPRLVVKIEDQFYNWSTAAPLILSLLAFKQPLPPEVIGQSLNPPKHQDPQFQELLISPSGVHVDLN